MDEQTLKKTIQDGIKEAHFTGLQAGKKETSGLVDLLLHKMEPMIDKSVEKSISIYVPQYVNGKIDDIKKHLGDQDTKLNTIIAEQGKVKMALNIAETVTNPLIKIRQFWTIIFSGVLTLTGFIKGLSAIIIAVAAVLVLFKIIK